jgi:CheY-like chemotaxis protein
MKLLAHAGHQAVIASTLDEARAAFARQHFDILLCDITLPDGDGCDLIAELRARRPDVRGIAISAAAYPRDAQRCLEAGFTLHLAKPITVEGLLGAVDSLTLDAAAQGAPAGAAQPKAG